MARVGTDRASVAAADRVLAGVSRLGSRMRAERPRAGLSLAVLGVLLRLSVRGTMTTGALAASLRVAPQSMTRIVAGMAENGLIDRRADPDDRRQILVSMTEAGRRVFDEDTRTRRAWLAAAMDAELTTAERDLLRIAGDLMVRLADWQPPTD
jgi:DNA-binding MarR family transcriptional regulator